MSTDNQSARTGFRDQVVWITGASSGIGAALAGALAAEGARLVLSARRESVLAEVGEDCLAAGAADVQVLPMDITDHAAMPATVAAVEERHGRVDLLVNNAGISQRSLCLETDLSVYRQLLEVDVLGQIALTQAVLPGMVQRGGGHLAVTASVAGKVGVPLRTGYCAAKHAVMGFFDALRTEVAHHGIRVTTMVPGYINTDIARNALTGSGAPTGEQDEDIANGLPVEECARRILHGFRDGTEEIAVGGEMELGLLEMKRTDPTGTFRMLETLAEPILRGRQPAD